MLPGITPALMGAPPDLNGNDAFTVLLLHCNGVNASTVFTDYSPKQRGNAGVVGIAQVSAGYFKFGSGSVYIGSNGALTYPAHADFNMGSGDFTLECQFNVAGAGGGTYRTMFGQMDSAATLTTHSFSIRLSATNQLYATVAQGGSNVVVTGGAAVTDSIFHHAALVRFGNALKLFLDGVQVVADVAISGAINSSANLFAVGRIGEYTGQQWPHTIDEIRISKGIARWTANFTPPTKAYGIAAPATKLIVQVPASGTTGTAFNVQVHAADESNKPTTNYSGTVRITCNDGAANMPANSVLTNGYGQFSMMPRTGQTTTVTATDTVTSSITGSANISVAAAAAQAAAWASTTSWTVPANWNNANNSIECIGGGGNGALGGGGGGGGAYSKVSNVTLTPGEVCNVRVDGPGGYTLFQRQSGTTLCQAAPGGTGAINFVPGAGGNAANGVGAIRYNGGSGNTGGGGGAGGPYGNGGPGGAYNAQMGHEGGGGGGGGGAGGGNASSAGPGAGGNSYAWGGGGAAGTDGVNGGAGTNGGGGGGGYNTSAYGGAGGNGIDMGSWGSGGGGGGSWMTGGGAGGYYGGGGGGGGDSVVGVGRTGLIVVRWQP